MIQPPLLLSTTGCATAVGSSVRNRFSSSSTLAFCTTMPAGLPLTMTLATERSMGWKGRSICPYSMFRSIGEK
jgi:hypothetical protein